MPTEALERGLPLQIRVGLNTGKWWCARFAPMTCTRTMSRSGMRPVWRRACKVVANRLDCRQRVHLPAHRWLLRLQRVRGGADQGVSDRCPSTKWWAWGRCVRGCKWRPGEGLVQFVGRQRELELMQQAWEQAKRGRGQIVAAVGEPGVGKSRLLPNSLQHCR